MFAQFITQLLPHPISFSFPCLIHTHSQDIPFISRLPPHTGFRLVSCLLLSVRSPTSCQCARDIIYIEQYIISTCSFQTIRRKKIHSYIDSLLTLLGHWCLGIPSHPWRTLLVHVCELFGLGSLSHWSNGTCLHGYMYIMCYTCSKPSFSIT